MSEPLKKYWCHVVEENQSFSMIKAADVARMLSDSIWRSLYPTKEGYWWHRGPSGTFIRRVRMAPAMQLTGLWPYDADSHEALYMLDGEWAQVLGPPEAQRLLAEWEGKT